jgi:hypothetical protein
MANLPRPKTGEALMDYNDRTDIIDALIAINGALIAIAGNLEQEPQQRVLAQVQKVHQSCAGMIGRLQSSIGGPGLLGIVNSAMQGKE